MFTYDWVYFRITTVKIMFSEFRGVSEEVILFLSEEGVLSLLSGYKSGKFVAVNFEQQVANCLEHTFELTQFGAKIDPITS